MKKTVFWWVVVFLWCGMIFMVTASPAATSDNTISILESWFHLPPHIADQISFIMRKGAHLTFFGLLAIFLLLANWGRKYAPLLAWVLATVYGATDEIHQMYRPDRGPAVTDVMIDSAGAVIALLLFYFVRQLILGRIRD